MTGVRKADLRSESAGAKASAEQVAAMPSADAVADMADGATAAKDASAESEDRALPTEGAEEALDEAQRALAEHNALARAFDDVRAQSREGLLVEPSRWSEIGLVPEHMDADVFALFVREYWKAEHPDGNMPARTSAGGEGSGGGRAAAPRAHDSAIREVGVPPFLRGRHGMEGRSDASAAQDGATVDSAPEQAVGQTAVDAPGGFGAVGAEGTGRETGASTAPAEAGADDPFANLKLPEGYRLVELEGEWVLVPDEDAEPEELVVDCENVVLLEGRHGFYLYDRTCMTDAFARWAFLAAEDDDVATFVTCVREESRTYPRPMPIEALENDPFRFSRERIARTWDAVRDSGEYPDIRQVAASNGDVFCYSTDYLSADYAASLAEWAAVERLRNV